jgi:hypothetical protein
LLFFFCTSGAGSFSLTFGCFGGFLNGFPISPAMTGRLGYSIGIDFSTSAFVDRVSLGLAGGFHDLRSIAMPLCGNEITCIAMTAIAGMNGIPLRRACRFDNLKCVAVGVVFIDFAGYLFF